MAKKSARRKSVRSKCIKTCPRNIRLKCRSHKDKRGVEVKLCNLNIPGLLKQKNLSSGVAGKMVGAAIRALAAKRCITPIVHRN